MRFTSVLAITALLTLAAAAEELKPATVAAFDEYVHRTEQRVKTDAHFGNSLWIDTAPPAQRNDYYSRLRKGEVLTRPLQTLADGRQIHVPDGLIHHWIGLVFIPGASLAATVALLQDYDQQHRFYAPEVERSRLIRRNGNDFHVFLRLRRKKIVTVVLNTEYDVHYTTSENSAYARSYSTRIAEVEDAGKASEREKPVGNDDGFLWRLNSYWYVLQRDGGTYVQLEAISLTRDIPAGLGWLIRPFVTSVPQESLQFTLTRTRASLFDAQRLSPASSARLISGRKPQVASSTP